MRNLCEELNLESVVDPIEVLPQNGKVRYYRLHGKGGCRYKYTEEELAALKRAAETGQETYVMFNNVFMYDDALAFKEMLDPVP